MNDLGSKIPAAVESLGNKLPRFPDGRIDYTHATVAPVILCFVQWQDKILLLKRSEKVLSYKNKWNTVGGYLDELKTLRQFALDELREELGISETTIKDLVFVEPHEHAD